MSILLEPVRTQPSDKTRKAMRSPRAAAVAGILFAFLFSTSLILVRLAIPESLSGATSFQWIEGRTDTITLALTLVPFSGLAFLWFMGVVRDRLGELEDQFFSTVFFGSGLLFLALTFMAGAIAGAVLASYAASSSKIIESGLFSFARSAMYTLLNVYAIRMAGVFMISLGTLWLRTGVMPRLFALVTYGVAILMLVVVNLSLWLILLFPAWVFAVSVYILFVSLRGDKRRAEELVGAP